jgi:hypothetical protein
LAILRVGVTIIIYVVGVEGELERAREAEAACAKKVAELQKQRNRLGVARARIIASQKKVTFSPNTNLSLIHSCSFVTMCGDGLISN